MHYVIGDVHGHYTEFMKLLDKLDIKEDDIVFLVGDVVDRAPSATEQKLMLDWCYEHISQDGQYRMVLGNHEAEYLYGLQHAKKLWEKRFNEKWNGSPDSVKGYVRDNYGFFAMCKEADIDLNKFLDFIEQLPLFCELTVNNQKYFVCHSWLVDNAGHSCIQNPKDANVLNSVWDRGYSVHNELDDCTVIHGHTPTHCREYYFCNSNLHPYVIKRKGNINIDCGLFHQKYGRGDLAAYCVEEDKVIYLYNHTNDVIET